MFTSCVHDQGDNAPINPAKDQDLSGRNGLVGFWHNLVRIMMSALGTQRSHPGHVSLDTWFTFTLWMRVTGSTLSGQRACALAPQLLSQLTGPFVFVATGRTFPAPWLGYFENHKAVQLVCAVHPSWSNGEEPYMPDSPESTIFCIKLSSI